MEWTQNIEAVVFDIGGTLLDFDRAESYAEMKAGAAFAHEYLLKLGHAPPSGGVYRRRILRRLGRAYVWSRLTGGELDPMHELANLHKSMGIELDSIPANELARLLYSPNKALARAHPKTADTLRAIQSAGMKIGLISNTVAPPSGLEDHLAQEGLLEYFSVRVFSCTVGVPKPNPKIFNVALEQLNVAPDRALYVGDKPHIDIVGARGVGMFAALRAKQPPTKKKHLPDICVRELCELIDHLNLSPSPKS